MKWDHADFLRVRVQRRIGDLGISLLEATKRSGLGKDFLYDLQYGRKKNIRSSSLEKLARALECDVDYLLGNQEFPRRVAKAVPVKLLGTVKPGLWMDVTIRGIYPGLSNKWFDYIVDEDHVPLPADPRYPIESQFDMDVDTDSLGMFAPRGHRLRCIFFRDPDVFTLGRDIFIVIRKRGNLHEYSARTGVAVSDTKSRKTGFEFEYPSRDPAWNETLSVDEGRRTPEGDLISVIGKVIFSYAFPHRKHG